MLGTLTMLLASSLPFTPAGAQEQSPPHAHEHPHGEAHDPVETIVVTASPLPHEADELAAPVDQLSRDEIVESLGGTIGETLRNLPGVTSSGFSAGASRPVIRGQSAFRVEVLENGLGTQDVSRLSPDHAIPVNPLSAQYLEVVRGPAVLRYGGGASGGAVNAITNRVPARRIDEGLTGQVIGLYGANANGRDLGVLLEGGVSHRRGDGAWHFDALQRRSDDYTDGTGTKQPGTETETVAVAGGAAWFLDDARMGFAYSRYDSEYGIPGPEVVEIDMTTNRFRFEADYEPGLAPVRSLKLRGVYSDYTHHERVDGVVGQSFDNQEFDGRLELLHEHWFGFLGAAGLHGKTQDLTASGEAEEFLAPSETSLLAFYLFEERPLTDVLDLELGLRVEGSWVEGTPFSGTKRNRRFAPLSGSVALVVNPTPALSLGLMGTAAQRAPSQVELFARGPHDATGTFEIGNPGFDEETSYNGELRIDGDLGRLRASGTAFATLYQGFIYGRLTGVTVDEDGTPSPMGELDQLFYDDRDALFYGGEAELGVELGELLGGLIRTDWQIDYVRARFTSGDSNRNVPRITPMRWGGNVSYEHERVSGKFGFLQTEKQWSGADGEFEAGRFTMLNLSAVYRLPFFEDTVPLEIGVTARNLLDHGARNAVSFNKEEVRSIGRDVHVSVHGRF